MKTTSCFEMMPTHLTIIALALVGLLACTPQKEEAKESAEGGQAEQTSEQEEGRASAEEATGSQEETGAEGAAEETEAAPQDGETVPPGETRHFGGDFTIEDAPMSLESALADVEKWVGKTVKVEGTVKTACRKKGCWMQLSPHSEEAEPLRVTFKDYGFFVPKKADGSHAVMEGEFIVDTMTEAKRKHLAEDAEKSQEEIDAIKGDIEVVSFVATAVDLTGPDTE